MKRLLCLIAMLFVLPQAYSASNSVSTPLLTSSVLPVTGSYMNGNTFSITYRGTMELVDFHKNRFEVLYDDAVFELVNPNILTSTGIFMTPTTIAGGRRYETPVYSFANAYFGVTEFTLSFRVITTSCLVPPQFIRVTLGTLNPSTGVVSELGTRNLTININNTNAPPTIDAPVLIRGSVCSGSAIYRIRTMGRTDVTNWMSMSLPPGVNIQAVYNSAGTQVLSLNVYPYNSGWFTPSCTPLPGDADAPNRIAWWNRESSPDVQYHYVLVNFTAAGPCSGRLCASFHNNLYCTTTPVTVAQRIDYSRCSCPVSTNTGTLPLSDSGNLGRLIITKTFETIYPLQYFCAPNNCKEHKYVITVDNISNTDVNNVKVEDFLDALNASAGPSAITVTGIDVSLSNIIPGPSVPFNLSAPTVAGVAPISPSVIYSDGTIHPVYSNTHISAGIWPPMSNPAWGIGLGGGSTLPKHTSLKITIWHKLNTCPSSFTDPLVNHMTNTAKLTADNTSGVAHDVTIYRSDTVDDAYKPVIAVEKVVRSVVAGPAFNSVVHAAPGEEVEFKVTIRNLGMAPGNVDINDVLSATCPSDLIPTGGFTVADNTRDGTGTLMPVYSSGDISAILSSIGTPAITGWASSAPVTIQASSSCDAVSTLIITYRATIPVDPCCELQYDNVISLTDPMTSLVVDHIRIATVVVDRFKYIELKLEATCDSADASSWRNTTINATPGQRIYYRAAVRNNNNINLSDIKMMVQLSGIIGPNSTIHNSVPAITLSSFNSLSGTGITGPLGSLIATGMPAPVSSLFLYDDWLSTNPTTTSPVAGNAIYADGVALSGSPSPGVPGAEYIVNYYIDAPTELIGNVYNTALGLGLASGTLCPFVVSTDLLLILADSSSCDSVAVEDTCVCTITGDSVICSGESTIYTSSCTGGIWSSSIPACVTINPLTGIAVGGSAPCVSVISYTLPSGCVATFTVTVNTSPAPITGAPLVCLGSTTTLNDGTPGGFWSSSNLACGTVNATTGVVTGIIAPCTTVITYMLSSGCYSTAIVSINPVPHMCSISVCSICSGELFSYTPSSTTTGATFAWSRPAVPGISNPAATGAGNPNELLINTTGSPIVVVYVYTITAGGCFSTYNVSVTVYPSPVSTYSVTGGGIYCAGTTCPVIGLSGSTAGIIYKLYCGSTYTGVSAMGTGGALSFGPQCGPCLYTVVAVDTAHGCESEMTDSAIVAPYPPCPIMGDTILCVGNVTTLSACPGGIWSSSNPTVASIGMTGVVTANAAGTATIQFTSINGCITTVVVTVTDFPSVPVITGSLFVCTGGIGTSLTATPAPGTWMLFGATHGTLSPSNPYVGSGVTFNGTSVGVQQIFYMYSNCCGTSLASVNVTVGAMSPVVGPDTVCVGSTIILTDATTGGTWTSSDSTLASINSSGVVTGHTIGSVVISYLLPSGCIAIKSVYIINCPCSFMCVNGDFETPVGTGSRHIAESTLSPCWQTTEPGNTIELWGSVGTVPAAHGVQFCEINSNVASTTVHTDFTGIPGSTVNIRFAHRGRYTNPDTMAVYIEQSTTGGVFTAPVYPGPPTSATQIGQPRYADNFGGGWNYYTITYTLPNTSGPTRLYFHSVATGIPGVVGGNWLDDVSVNLAISPITGPDTICEGTYATEVAGDTCGTWSSSNSAVATVGETTGIIYGESAGTFTLTFTNCNGCISTKVITVRPIPVIVGPFTLCVGSTINMSEDSVICLTWSSSSTSVATVGSGTGVVTGVSSGTSVITVVNCSGCYATQTVTVHSSPASCTLSGGGSNCGGVCPEVVLSCSTPGISYQLYNGSTPIDASVPGTGAPLTFGGQCAVGTYTVMATNTTTGCFSAMTGSAVVTACAPCPPCPISGPGVLCAGQSIALSDSCPGGTWSSSDTTNATVDAISGIVSGMSAGTANITYTVGEGCYTVIVVTVNATPSTITGTLFVCIGNVTTLSTSPTGGTWTSGSTMRATVGASTGVVIGVSAGTADISYTLAGGCRRKVTVTVVATPSPITGTLTVCSGSTTLLSSATTGGIWSSSDTGTASVDATTGLVTGVGSSGTSIITYTVGGCFQTVVVTVSAMLGANTGSPLVCVGQNSDLDNATAGGTWSSSNTTIATVHAGTGLVTGISAGTATISYQLGGGCFSVTVVTVNAALAGITGTASVCPGVAISLSNATTGGVWSSSNTAIATVVAGTGLVTGVSAGTATISYLISSGCYQTITVTVNTAPGTIGGTAYMCVGATVSLSCSPGGGTWSSASPATASVTSGGSVTGLMAGTTTISYQSGAGCVATLVLTVTAAPGSIGGTLSACMGATTTLSSTPGGGTWSSSNAARATVGAGTGLVTGVSAGTVIITYAISATCYSTAVVTINATPGSITGTLTLCAGCNTTLSSATTGGSWSSSNTAAATIGIATGVVSGVGTGTTTISYVASGCAVTAVVTVTPATSPSTGTPVVCVGQTNATLSNPISGGTWSSSNTTIATVHAATGLLTGVGAGNADITYTTSPGVYTVIVATVSPAMAMNAGTFSICPLTTTTLTNATTGGTWSSSNVLRATVVPGTGEVTGVASGTVNISYILNVGCYRVSGVTIKSQPNITTSASVTSVVLGGTRILNASPGGGAWSSAAPAIATATGSGVGTITGVSVGATTVTYTNSAYFGGCFRTRAMTVTPARPGSPVVSEAVQASVLKVFPNPTSGTLTIDAPVAGTFTVYTIDGKQVAQYTVAASVNMVTLPSNLAAGIYMCRFIGAEGTLAIVRLVYEQ